jgi:hypothetical protein
MFLGHSEDGFAGLETALRLSPRDPLVPWWQFNMCHLHTHLAQWEQAIVRQVDREWQRRHVPVRRPRRRQRLGRPRQGAVAAGIVGDARVRAVLAALDVSAELGGSTGLDRRHDLQLAEADMAGIGLAPRRPMGAKDVGDPRAVSRGPRHAPAVRRAAIGWRC